MAAIHEAGHAVAAVLVGHSFVDMLLFKRPRPFINRTGLGDKRPERSGSIQPVGVTSSFGFRRRTALSPSRRPLCGHRRSSERTRTESTVEYSIALAEGSQSAFGPASRARGSTEFRIIVRATTLWSLWISSGVDRSIWLGVASRAAFAWTPLRSSPKFRLLLAWDLRDPPEGEDPWTNRS